MKKPFVLVACEESGRVTEAFRNNGCIAFSCDVMETSGNHPEWHIVQDVLPLMNGFCEFDTQTGVHYILPQKWDAIIAFPPCTYLTNSGNKYFDVSKYGEKAEKRWKDRFQAAEFFMKFAQADSDCIAIENPVGYMNTHFRKPDQIIHPYFFGHPVSKKTCLWLKNLAPLSPSKIVPFESIHSKGKSGGYSGPSWYVTDENGRILPWTDPMTARIRSKTYEGIASAIGEQWGSYLIRKVNNE